ncbi:MAG: large conductance mechanosensitive channel protein MscL [Brevefilum sp.]|nr:large conductance mechanosensitive channel protein MscL [Brevefilum sp.]MDT8381469.1 large conductance mechanosensitive channel protein MscL [Brevefilum sp.]MDW7754301.1 large conductance mechanosensitive channel protein MscL [Brevefilum sp.]
MKKLINEFKDFISRGNVIDLAIGVIIGGAFSTIVKSMVDNLLMPPLGLLFGNADFADLFVVLKQGSEALPGGATLEMAKEVGAVTFNYGQFITDLLSFLLLALGVFLIVKAINAFHREKEEPKAEPTEKDCPFCKKAIPVEATRCPFCTSNLE